MNDNKLTCPLCHGNGEIEETRGGAGDPEYDVPVTCSLCNGEGLVTQEQIDAYEDEYGNINDDLTPYEQWQLGRFGNIISSKDMPDNGENSLSIAFRSFTEQENYKQRSMLTKILTIDQIIDTLTEWKVNIACDITGDYVEKEAKNKHLFHYKLLSEAISHLTEIKDNPNVRK